MQRNQARQVALKALAEDPTVFQYDEVYDEMQQKKEEKKPPKEERKVSVKINEKISTIVLKNQLVSHPSAQVYWQPPKDSRVT